MSDFTITSKEAILLTWKAQECLTHDMFFAHSLLHASPEEIEVLRVVIKRANTLRATKMDQAQEKVHRGIKLTDRMLRDRSHIAVTERPQGRRLHRIKSDRIETIEAQK